MEVGSLRSPVDTVGLWLAAYSRSVQFNPKLLLSSSTPISIYHHISNTPHHLIPSHIPYSTIPTKVNCLPIPTPFLSHPFMGFANVHIRNIVWIIYIADFAVYAVIMLETRVMFFKHIFYIGYYSYVLYFGLMRILNNSRRAMCVYPTFNWSILQTYIWMIRGMTCKSRMNIWSMYSWFLSHSWYLMNL